MPEQETRTDINPQLCKTLNPAKHKWTHPWIAEPKFDGLRCWVVVDYHGKASAYSRNGKPLWNMKAILEDIEDAGFQDYVLDGEVYTKDWNLSMSIVKRSTQDHPDMDKLRYHVWDCIKGEEMQATWKDAQGKTHKVFSPVSNRDRKEDRIWVFKTLELEHVQVVEGIQVSNDEELSKAYLDFLAQGYEGAILKDPEAGYYGGRRAPHWLKIKPWTDADLKIVGAIEGNGKFVGMLGKVELEGEAEWNDKTYQVKTECGTGFNDEERVRFWSMWNKGTLVGKIMEIKFQDITVEGACRFPVYNRLREDKE